MLNRTLRRLADVDEVSRAAAEQFVRIAAAANSARRRCIVALAGGTTPRLLYRLLAEEPFRSQVDWTRVEFFWGDERAVPPDHADSNYGMARQSLLRTLPLRSAQVHRMEGERADLDTAARDYEAELARVCGVSPQGDPPVLDLALLGMGADGHTASLFPHTSALRETRRWVVANHVPKLNADRLTLTPGILNRAANVLFLVAGADKAAALVQVLEGPPDHERLPSQLIQSTTGTLTWLMDEAALKNCKLQISNCKLECQ
jgi:6-phosphogluconolactonase